MRIRRLEIKAFGPFTGRVVEFPIEPPGLHIVYGPNEAGKSSCLRALKALLFGIPARTADSFLHPYDQLMVGGCLRAENGRELTFYRRKKKKADLFDREDEALDPALLSPFLQGCGPAVFDSLYGIDHEALVRGGQEILNQKGEVGQAIFSAGAGLTTLSFVLEELETEAEELFRPRASTKALNEALSEYRDLQGKMKQAALSSQAWQEHGRALQEAEEALKAVLALRADKEREKRRLERMSRALPHLVRRRTLLEKRAGLGDVVVLPADFSERRRKVEQERSGAARDRDGAISRLRELERKREGMAPQQELLDRADAIETLVQRLGEHRKAMSDRPKLEGMRARHETEAAGLLRQIRPGLSLSEVESLRPGLLKKRTIQDLGARQEALIQTITLMERDIRKSEEALTRAGEELLQVPSRGEPDALHQKIRLAQQAGSLDEELKERHRALKFARQSAQASLDKLGLWRGPLNAVNALAVPMVESLNRFEEELDALQANGRDTRTETEQLQSELRSLRSQWQEIRYSGEVPTETELMEARSRRDLGWQLLKRRWVQREDVAEEVLAFSPAVPLHETYERLAGLSDQRADRLRREADRVQKDASLRARVEILEKRERQLKEAAQQLEGEITAARERWQALWAGCGIDPLSPREMRQWLADFERLCFQVRETERAAAEIEEKERSRQELRRALIEEMERMGERKAFPGAEITPVLIHAEALRDQVKSDQARREKLENRVHDLDDALRSAQEEKRSTEERRQAWKEGWARALGPLGLGPEEEPSDAVEFIETLQRCFDDLKAAEDLQKRMDGIDRDRRAFQEEVAHLVGLVAPDLEGAELLEAVSALQARLNRARQEQAVLHQLQEEMDSLKETILQAETALKSHQAEMASLLRAAHCASEEALDKAEGRSREFLELQREVSEVESALGQIAEGIAFSELERQAGDLDPDALPGQIEALGREIEARLEPDIRRLSETVGKEKSEMARMDGRSLAADLAEASQEVAARIRRLTERFMRVRLGARILRDVIERYRAEHQDPVLRIASRVFREITLGSFTGLRTDMDEEGQAVLIGLRPDGAWVRVEGMSNGTRDQLYLALRLATLAWRAQSLEPMPFIVDDILINFDDDRSRAALSVMAELAEKNQILLFTHHRRILEAAGSMDGGGRVFIHEL